MLFGLPHGGDGVFLFLAIPTLFAATGYEFVKNRALLAGGDLSMIAVGFVVAFVAHFLSCAGCCATSRITIS
jgi:undecaprenyl-diphosphatase